LKDHTVKSEQHTPSAKAKDDVARISNVRVKSAVFDETLRLKRFGIRIGVLVMRHAPVNAIRVGTIGYLEKSSELTIN
jgi:hypothetical protein